MSHTYTFSVFPGNEFLSWCTFTYKSESVIPNNIIESVARSILTNCTILWLQGAEQCLNPELNMATLKSILTDQNEQQILSWLEPFTTLQIQNDDPENRYMRTIYMTNIFIKIE